MSNAQIAIMLIGGYGCICIILFLISYQFFNHADDWEDAYFGQEESAKINEMPADKNYCSETKTTIGRIQIEEIIKSSCCRCASCQKKNQSDNGL